MGGAQLKLSNFVLFNSIPISVNIQNVLKKLEFKFRYFNLNIMLIFVDMNWSISRCSTPFYLLIFKNVSVFPGSERLFVYQPTLP